MIKEIRHTGLVVFNLEEALSFWRDLLGFKIIKIADEAGPYIDAMMGLKDVKVTTVKMSAPEGGVIELLHFKSHPDVNNWSGKPYSTGFTHIALTVSNLQKCYEKLSISGVKFPGPPKCAPDGSVKVIYCSGPENVLIELVELIEK